MTVHKTGRCRLLSRDLDGHDLDALVRATRRHRVTLNSALNAAMLLVIQKQLYEGAAVPLRNFNFAILRPYLQPPMDDHHLGSFHVMLRSTLNLEREHDFWRLASTINSQLVASAVGETSTSHYLPSPMSCASSSDNERCGWRPRPWPIPAR